MRFGDHEIDTARRELRCGDQVIDVEPQVFDVLTYLAEHRDRVVSKHELLDEVWGTRFVTESSLTSRIRSARRAVGDSGREQRVIKTVFGHGYRFVAEVIESSDAADGSSRSGEFDAAEPEALDRLKVTAPLNSLVGRDAELARLAALVAEHRLVAVVGNPGVGSTRLAIEFAARWEGPAAVANLAPDRAPLVSVAQALGVSDASEDRLGEACAQALAASDALLVLDAADRVQTSLDDTIMTLVSSAPGVRIVATARTPLGRSDEVVHRLDPLDWDGRDSAAVDLFVRRAGGALEADPTDDDLAVIERICGRLDGLPLAIELAASRLQHMTLTDLAGALDDHFELISTPASWVRHGTLDSMFEWSWEALDDDERALLGDLSEVPGDFDLAMAGAVGGPAGPQLTMRLLDRSLLAPGRAGARSYRFLETFRPFVQARTDADRRGDARRRLLDHVVERAELVAESLRTDDSAELLMTAAVARASATATLRAARAEPAGPVLRLATALATIVEYIDSDAEATAALLVVARDDALLATATTAQLAALGSFCDNNDTGRHADLAELALTRVVDDHDRMVALVLMGRRHANAGQLDDALAALDEAEQLGRRIDDLSVLAEILVARGMAYRASRDGRSAIDAFSAAGSRYAEMGDRTHVSNSRYLAARAAADAGLDTDAAVAWAEQSIAYGEATGNDHERAHGLLVRAALPGADDPTSMIGEALEIFRRVGDLRCVVRAHLALADQLAGAEQVSALVDALGSAVLEGDQRSIDRAGARLVEALVAADRDGDAATVWGALGSPVELLDAVDVDFRGAALRHCVDEGSAVGLTRSLDRLRTPG